jgi:hypothetical protein
MGRKPDVPDPHIVWTDVRMDPLVNLVNERKHRSHWASEWLINLAFFLMPESGIQWEPQLSNSLISFWKSDRRHELILQRRAQRLAQLRGGQDLKSPMGPIAGWLEQKPPLPTVFPSKPSKPAKRPPRARQ